jgi:predicted PurR-regulated permease PerM
MNTDEAKVGVLGWVVGVLAVAGLLVLAPYATPIVLGTWVAEIMRPLQHRLGARLRGRAQVAAILVSALVLVFLAPLVLAGVSLASEVIALYNRLSASQSVQESLVLLVQGESDEPAGAGPIEAFTWNAGQIFALVREHGTRAWSVVTTVAGATTTTLLSLFVFLFTVFAVLANRAAAGAWLRAHIPMRTEHLERLSRAFFETGRGLIVGQGMTALSQAVIALVAFLSLGVPRALALGLLTGIAALVPMFGPALVWVPVAAGLALAGRTGAAAIMAGVGVLIIGSVDNIARPIFARYAHLELPTVVLLVSIFGGLSVLGPGGLILGPLFVRLAIEALRIWRDVQLRRAHAA